ncbi:MAG: hypothetical protein JWM11_4212 [Planctomycetaceae bacterium]|nr:hypothetical protein [Planctomycetaceae bacterium]
MLRCGQELLGTVKLEIGLPQEFVGVFTPSSDFEHYRAIFERVFVLEREVQESSESNYQSAWHEWHESLGAIDRLGLTFGDSAIPIEDFEIDLNWRVTFRLALWWLAATEGESNSAPAKQTA